MDSEAPKKDLTLPKLEVSDSDFPNTLPDESAFPDSTDSNPPLESSQKIESFESLEELTANADPATLPLSSSAPEIAPEILPEAPSENSPETLPGSLPETLMDQVKDYSEKLADTPSSAVAAAFPFSVKITGKLKTEEQERLIEILSRENFGIREIDLEPQFAAGRLLIPRISEFAGVMLVQALRGSAGKVEFFPSDATAEAGSFSTPAVFSSPEDSSLENRDLNPLESTAETLPVTTGDSLPQFPVAQIIDTITATTTLHIDAVEFQSSPQYQEALDSLQREIKYKAYRKKAVGIIHYKIELSPLSFPTRYRLMATGSAIR